MSTRDILILTDPSTGLIAKLKAAADSLSTAISNNEATIEANLANKQTMLYDRLYSDIQDATSSIIVATRFLNKQ